jgi:SAM-dependent methyltransferase
VTDDTGPVFDGACTPMPDVVAYVLQCLVAGACEVVLDVGDPDSGAGRPAGTRLADGRIHRPYAVWTDLAGRLGLRLHTPDRRPDGRVRLRFSRIEPVSRDAGVDLRERYGADSWFASIDKREDPVFVLDLRDALLRATLPEAPRVLFLGVNRGDEVALVEQLLARPIHATGVDHSASAIAIARQRFPDGDFHVADLADLPTLALPAPDLVVAIDVLHSPSIDDQAVLHAVIALLAPNGAVCIGVPNCTYVGGERLPGARIRNLREPELSLMVKKVAHTRRFLHRHGFRVFVTGTHEVLVTGVR